MIEKLVSTLMASRDQAHIFHWQTTGPGSFAAHLALNAYYDAIPGMVDALVEAHQGKHGILKGYEPSEKFDDYSKETAIKYFKALGIVSIMPQQMKYYNCFALFIWEPLNMYNLVFFIK